MSNVRYETEEQTGTIKTLHTQVDALTKQLAEATGKAAKPAPNTRRDKPPAKRKAGDDHAWD